MKPRLMVACDGLLEILHHDFLLNKLMFQGYVFVGSFNYYSTNILRYIYAHTHRVSYGGIKKTTACSESPPKGGK